MMQATNVVTRINVASELWASSILPQGLIEEWLRSDGSAVEAGDTVVTVRIENALHELMAPARGRLQIGLKTNSVIEPGTTIGSIIRQMADV